MAAEPTEQEVWIPTRKSLLERLRKENSDADWQLFFETYWRLIYRTAAQAGLRPSECEDVVQETVLSVFKKLPDFEYCPEKGHFKGWLYQITRWRISDYRRAQMRRERILSNQPLDEVLEAAERSTEPLPPEWEEQWEANLREAALDRLKNQVDPTYYQIFHLSDIKGWSGRQVARLLKVSLPVVYTAKHRARRQLKLILESLKQNPEQGMRNYEND